MIIYPQIFIYLKSSPSILRLLCTFIFSYQKLGVILDIQKILLILLSSKLIQNLIISCHLYCYKFCSKMNEAVLLIMLLKDQYDILSEKIKLQIIYYFMLPSVFHYFSIYILIYYTYLCLCFACVYSNRYFGRLMEKLVGVKNFLGKKWKRDFSFDW